ncbi:3'(2'),5'-bisphosphate nucleotidase CysQ [Amaricoccus solimangrovi]|uniref:3'(2'),5'-bisphosphate nucleotidase CysQ n=1 Tax=Amaricoccus solimangrovi TaxID=2589815 RepID=A0A501WRJ9_9RHOB|nr:3'(2'),5'-bisphosphate nucleotidase CysQ [Amaricoccus solimangrovi]TPE52089.1 3'(2'),5'-bisphosphate nucleotidase CysQ [Amaricoccus solimangrovi]
MPATDLALITEAAEAAGEIARRHFNAAPRTWEKPGGFGPVTEADLEIDAMLHERLLGARPGYGWLSEESPDDPARLEARRVFVLDPIDGTRAFIAGQKGWAHSIAVAERGEIVAAVVHLPMLGRTYAARLGHGATLNGQPIAASGREALDGARLLATSATMDPGRWVGRAPEFDRHFRPSLANRVCLVAEGRFDAMLTLRPTWEWDVAAGDLIAREAGAAVATATGAAPRYNAPDPRLPGFLAAAPALRAPLLRRLAAD